MHLLMRHAGRVVTQPQLLRELWGPTHEDDTHYLRILVGQAAREAGRRRGRAALHRHRAGRGPAVHSRPVRGQDVRRPFNSKCFPARPEPSPSN